MDKNDALLDFFYFMSQFPDHFPMPRYSWLPEKNIMGASFDMDKNVVEFQCLGAQHFNYQIKDSQGNVLTEDTYVDMMNPEELKKFFDTAERKEND